MSFGTTPLSTTVLSTNQFPTSAVAEPGLSGGNLTALEGGPGSVDSNGNRTAPASMYMKGGNFIDFGAQADSAASTDTGTFSYMALFKRALQKLTSLVTNTNAFTSLGTDQAGSMIKVSMYGTNAVAGDTAFPINASGNVKTNINGISGGVTFNPGNTPNTTPWLVTGSNNNAAQPANTAGNVVVKGSAGLLQGAIITATGTVGLTVYDNASANSGTALLVIPANPTVGQLYPVNGWAKNGIVSAGVANCPGVTFFFA